MNKKGFVVSAVLYPLLILFLALIMGLISMSSTRKNILNNMKLDIADSIFDDATCSCETISNKLDTIIRGGITVGGSSSGIVSLDVKKYDTRANFPVSGNARNDIAIVSTLEINGYFLSDTQPKYPTEGSVWVHVKQTSPVTLYTGDVNIPIAYVEQYQSGEWVKVESALYDGTDWQTLNYTTLETATPDNIEKGYTAIVNGEKVTGILALNNSSFTFSTKRDDGAYLNGKKINVVREYASAAATVESLRVHWTNDNNEDVFVNLCNDVDGWANYEKYSNNSKGNGSWTATYCGYVTSFQVSPTIVAVVWVKEVEEATMSKYGQGIVDWDVNQSAWTESASLKITDYLYISTFATDGTTLTKKAQQQINKENLKAAITASETYNYTAYNGTTGSGGDDRLNGSSQTERFDIKIYPAPFDTLYNTHGYNIANEATSNHQSLKFYIVKGTSYKDIDYEENHATAKTNGDTDVDCTVAKSMSINMGDGHINIAVNTLDSDGAVTTRRVAGGCETYYDLKGEYSNVYSYDFTNFGVNYTTYNNKAWETATKYTFQDIRPTYNSSVRAVEETLTATNWGEITPDGPLDYVSTTFSNLSTRRAYNDLFEGTTRYLMHPFFAVSDTQASLTINAVEYGRTGNIGSVQYAGSPTIINLSGIVPAGSTRKGTYSGKYIDKMYYYIVPYTTGNLYIKYKVVEKSGYNDRIYPAIESIGFVKKENISTKNLTGTICNDTPNLYGGIESSVDSNYYYQMNGHSKITGTRDCINFYR